MIYATHQIKHARLGFLFNVGDHRDAVSVRQFRGAQSRFDGSVIHKQHAAIGDQLVRDLFQRKRDDARARIEHDALRR